jgi:preprotein translocase subunit SecF
LLSVLALLFFGGETLRGFAAALTIGIVIGTYSSIFIATSLALTLGVGRADLLPQSSEQGEAQETP